MTLSRQNRWLGRARRVVGRPPLIFVLGSQRSGTNALRQSLSLDPWIRGFNEHKSNRLYENWVLRPEPEIRWFLRRQPGTVLLKPIRSVIDRPVSEFLDEFADYQYKIAWIYRDPVLVFSSRRRRWPSLDDVEQFTAEWNRINGSAVAARDGRMAVVSHADLNADRGIFEDLCGFLDVNGEYLFRGDTSRAYEQVDRGDIDRIRQATADTHAALDRARGVPPGQR